ncbi:MAG: zinc ribbon domain-containing protein [Elainellaceae cyanobacterium]
MPECPRCQHTIDYQALSCPACGTQLKAYGHPGIALHQAADGNPLCPSCQYHHDDTCNFPQRPTATQCTLYQPPAPEAIPAPTAPLGQRIRAWLSDHSRALLWIGLAVVSVFFALR